MRCSAFLPFVVFLPLVSPSYQVMHLTPDLNPATHHLIANEFLPDMPDNPYKSGWRGEFYSLLDWTGVETMLSQGQSLAAVDSATGELLGVSIMTDQTVSEDVFGPFFSGNVDQPMPFEKRFWDTSYLWSLDLASKCVTWINSILPTSFVPSYLATSPPLPPNANPAVLEAAHPTQIVGYSVEKVMDRLNCSRVMFLQMLSVAKKARRRGIATNLARASEVAASKRGCDCVTSWATSEYSARILQKLGWSKQERLRYDDYKDPATGRKYIVDHQPHVEMAAFEKKIEPQPFI